MRFYRGFSSRQRSEKVGILENETVSTKFSSSSGFLLTFSLCIHALVFLWDHF